MLIIALLGVAYILISFYKAIEQKLQEAALRALTHESVCNANQIDSFLSEQYASLLEVAQQGVSDDGALERLTAQGGPFFSAGVARGDRIERIVGEAPSSMPYPDGSGMGLHYVKMEGNGRTGIVLSVWMAQDMVLFGCVDAAQMYACVRPGAHTSMAQSHFIYAQTGELVQADGVTTAEMPGSAQQSAAREFLDRYARGEVASRMDVHGEGFYAIATPLQIENWAIISVVPAAAIDAEYESVWYIIRAFLFVMGAIVLLLTFVLIWVWGWGQKARDAQQEALRQWENRYAALEAFSDLALFEVRIKQNTLAFNPRLRNMLGWTEAAMPADQLSPDNPAIYPEDRALFADFIREIRQGGEKGEKELRIYNAANEVRHVRVSYYSDPDSAGGSVIGKISDIEHERRTSHAATTVRDTLTGLYNAATARALIDQYLGDAGGHGLHAMLLIDIDEFQALLTHNQEEGEAYLKEFSTELTALFRSSDIIGRVGRDTFMVLMKAVMSWDSIRHRAMEVCLAAQSISIESLLLVTCSMGICTCMDEYTTFDDLYEKAEEALRSAKNNGKNRYCVYGEGCSDAME